MSPIRKRIVTDENLQPVAVQIDYADWLRIEEFLGAHTDSNPPPDLSRHVGTIDWGEDGVAYQRRVREEWDR